jgi:hypothetical protein
MKIFTLTLLGVVIGSLAMAQPQFSGVYGNYPHCQSCHSQSTPPTNQYLPWSSSPHSAAYDHLTPAQQQDPLCLPCHTTGWDLASANGGFDDYFYNGDSLGVEQMRNVQCESCHGPTNQTPHPSTTVVDYHSELCGDCHTGAGRPAYDEWLIGPHGRTAPQAAQNPACAKCHEARSAFVYHSTGIPLPVLPQNPVWQVTCAACHATHSPHLFAFQLFLEADSTCKACHNMDQAVVGQTPHATQQNMLRGVGSGAYEWPGYTYSNSCHWCEVPGTCVLCHMDTTTYSGPSVGLTGHTVQPRFETCVVCHSAYIPPDSSFNFFGVQTEIDSLLAVLGAALAQSDTTTLDYTRAKFNYDFVLADGSRGVHNSYYAEGLLISSIQHLPPSGVSNPMQPFGPYTFKLHPAYPNPFNASTILEFEVHVPSIVRLEVFDTAGNLVVTLVEGWRSAGLHEVALHGSKLASGVYLCRLQAASNTAMIKVVLIK